MFLGDKKMSRAILLILWLIFDFILTPGQHYLFVRSQHWKHQHNAWNLFKVNSKDITTSLTLSLWLTLNRFHACSGVSIVNFEQVNTGWEASKITRVLYVASQKRHDFIIKILYPFKRHCACSKSIKTL